MRYLYNRRMIKATPVICSLFLLVAISSCATPGVDSRRVSTAERGIEYFEGETNELPKAVIDYLRVVLQRVIKTEGEYIFDLPEAITRKAISEQIAFQSGRLFHICTHQNEPINNLAEDLKEADVLAMCLEHSDTEIAEAVDYVSRNKM